jgi:hypothetical protein
MPYFPATEHARGRDEMVVLITITMTLMAVRSALARFWMDGTSLKQGARFSEGFHRLSPITSAGVDAVDSLFGSRSNAMKFFHKKDSLPTMEPNSSRTMRGPSCID